MDFSLFAVKLLWIVGTINVVCRKQILFIREEFAVFHLLDRQNFI